MAAAAMGCRVALQTSGRIRACFPGVGHQGGAAMEILACSAAPESGLMAAITI